MKKNSLIVLELLTVIVLLICFLWIGFIQNVQAEPSGNNQADFVTPTAPLPDSNIENESSVLTAESDESLPNEYIANAPQPNAFFLLLFLAKPCCISFPQTVMPLQRYFTCTIPIQSPIQLL